MADGIAGTFDAETERRFQIAERSKLLPYIRAYAAVVALVLLLYTVVNTVYFSREYDIRSTLLLVPTLLCLGSYFAASFWRRYPEHPMIDFASLLALGYIILADNVLLADEFARIGIGGHASIAIDGLIVGAFAAVALAGNLRWFVTWLVCHAAGFAAIMVLLETSLAGHIYASLSYAAGAVVALVINWALGRAHRTSFALGLELDAERAKTEELLYNVLPQTAAQRIREGQVVADSYADASVVFIDIVGFTELSKTVSPGHLIELLNSFFSLADRCAGESDVEKVKTVGDAYIAMSGGNVPARNSAHSAIGFARAVIVGLDEVCAETGLEVSVRVGIHSGPVVGGVIGATRMAYDYWGETMNVASRVEGVARPNGIAVSETTFLRAQGAFEFEPAEVAVLKGIGEMKVYRLK